MKQQLFAAVLGTVLVFPLAAYADGAYIGVNAGSARQKAFVEYENGSEKDSTTAYKLYGGYDFSKNFGVEAGYLDFGNGKVGFDDDFFIKGKTTSTYITATATLPVGERFSLFAKAGAAMNHSKLRNSDDDRFTDSTTSLMLGIGAAYNVTKNFSVVAEYEDFGKVAKIDNDYLKINLLSIGARYKF